MMRLSFRKKNMPRMSYLQAGASLACFFFLAAPSAPDCPKRLDSLVSAGQTSLDSGDVAGARRNFTTAYSCGMSKDSLCYFAAEIYIRAHELDTALTFNWALEKAGRFSRALCFSQRARIFRLIGWNREADSVLALSAGGERFDVEADVSASRGMLTLRPFSLTPINYLFNPGEDIDDRGREELRFKWSQRQDSWLKRTFISCNVRTDAPVPTRYSFADKSDTLIESFSLYAGAGDLPSSAQCVLGHRIAVHSDGKTDHFSKISCSAPLWKTRVVQAEHETKWTGFAGIDEMRNELSLSQISAGRRGGFLCAVSLSHHFSQSDFYQNKTGTTGIYRSIPVGYIDSLGVADSSLPRLRYYRDANRTQPFDSDFMRDYWNGQPGMRLITIPHHDLNMSLQSALHRQLPFNLTLIIADFIQCVWFPQKVEWFSIDDTAHISFYDLYSQDAIVYDGASGKYYINTQRQQLSFTRSSFIDLKKHEKTRMDCTISGSAIIEKQLGGLGRLYFSTTYVKGFSTLTGNDPLVCLDRYWEMRIGWKKDISYQR